jgi:DNA polymerase-3 subunit delta'
LFSGGQIDSLEALARTLAKTLSCQAPPRRAENGVPLDSCDDCLSCRRIDRGEHPDVHELRPESKLRQVTVDQVRELIRTLQLKPHESQCKVGILLGADRLNQQAANAFLKTLEEPPRRSVLLLLSTEPDRLLETVRSRCLPLRFDRAVFALSDAGLLDWLKSFAAEAAAEQKGLLGRYHLLGLLLSELARRKRLIGTSLATRSPLAGYEEVEPELKEKWEAELVAAVEAEYRRQRADALGAALWWMRDVWLLTLGIADPVLALPDLRTCSETVARRLSSSEAMENLRQIEQTERLLGSTNVQEALALEVGLLRLKF